MATSKLQTKRLYYCILIKFYDFMTVCLMVHYYWKHGLKASARHLGHGYDGPYISITCLGDINAPFSRITTLQLENTQSTI